MESRAVCGRRPSFSFCLSLRAVSVFYSLTRTIVGSFNEVTRLNACPTCEPNRNRVGQRIAKEELSSLAFPSCHGFFSSALFTRLKDCRSFSPFSKAIDTFSTWLDPLYVDILSHTVILRLENCLKSDHRKLVFKVGLIFRLPSGLTQSGKEVIEIVFYFTRLRKFLSEKCWWDSG